MKNDMSPYILFYRKMADFNKTLTETNVWFIRIVNVQNIFKGIFF